MAYTDNDGKTILHSFGRFRGTVYEAVKVGDLLSRDTANEGWILADEEASTVAEAVACQDIAAGAVGWMAMAVEIQAPPTESGGDWSAGVLAVGADVCSPLYLDGGAEEGKASTSAGGTSVQHVGFILSTGRAILSPGQSLTGTAASHTTLAVSGTSTLGTTNFSSGKNVALVKGNLTLTEGDLTLTKGSATLTEGDLTLTKGALTLTEGDATLTDGDLIMTAGVVSMVRKTAKTETGTLSDAEQGYVEVSPVASTTLTLPTAAAGKYFLIKHLATTHTLIVAAGASDKLIDPSDGGVHDKATDDKGLDCILELRAVDAVNWLVIHHDGDWTFAD